MTNLPIFNLISKCFVFILEILFVLTNICGDVSTALGKYFSSVIITVKETCSITKISKFKILNIILLPS